MLAKVCRSINEQSIPADEEVRANNDCNGSGVVILNNPAVSSPMSKATLNTADKEHPKAHKKSSNKKHRPTTPLVDVYDGRNGKSDVKYVLNGL